MLAKWVEENTEEWEILTNGGWVPLLKTRRWVQNEFYCVILCKEDDKLSVTNLYDYQMSSLAAKEYNFYALIMAAMRNADSPNLHRLRMSFPDVWQVLQERYDAPGGRLEGE